MSRWLHPARAGAGKRPVLAAEKESNALAGQERQLVSAVLRLNLSLESPVLFSVPHGLEVGFHGRVLEVV